MARLSITVPLTPGLADALEKAADGMAVSKSVIVRWALREWLEVPTGPWGQHQREILDRLAKL